MKEPTDDPNPEVEADFREVTEQLQLPDLHLRSERRALVLAAFEQTRAIANLATNRIRWAWGIEAAAALVVGGVICYLTLALQRDGQVASAGATLAGAKASAVEDPALPELNVTLAIMNARTAAAERELTWLAALRAESEDAKEPSAPNPQPNRVRVRP
jgi:hypothetical protein